MPLVANYVPTDWVDTVTSVDATRMDNIDTNLDAHADAINALDTRLVAEEAQPDIPTVVNGSWIKGVGGAMVWSTIAIADVATLQTTLNGLQATSAKGAVNGYAGLDSTGKVPTTQLPTPTDLRYAGAYAAATAYKEGDVVIQDGISYMALRPTTGETPVPWGSGVTGGGGAGWDTTVKTAAQRDTTSTSPVDVPDLVVALLAGTTYEFEVLGITQSSTSAGLRLYMAYSGTGSLHFTGLAAGNLTQVSAVGGIAGGNTGPMNLAAATPMSAWLKGFVIATGNGNLTVQQAKITSGTASVLVNSYLRARKIS